MLLTDIYKNGVFESINIMIHEESDEELKVSAKYLADFMYKSLLTQHFGNMRAGFHDMDLNDWNMRMACIYSIIIKGIEKIRHVALNANYYRKRYLPKDTEDTKYTELDLSSLFESIFGIDSDQ